MKHPRTLVLVVLAITALTALADVSSASAQQFKSTSSPVMLFGEDNGNHSFKVDGQSVTCNVGVFEKASLVTPANVISGMTATYNSCTAFGFAGATVNMGNCTWEIGQPNTFTSTGAIRCTNKGVVNIHSSVFGSECTVSIHETNSLGHVVESNGLLTILLTFTTNGIKATKTKDNGVCPLSGTGETNNVSYEGPLTIEGTSGIGVSVG